MNPTSVLSWRNWVTEYGRVSSGSASFEEGAPLTNSLTPQSGQLAIGLPSLSSAVSFSYEIGGEGSSSSNSIGRRVGLVALVNTNIVADAGEVGGIVATITDQNGDTVTCTPAAVAWDGSGDVQQVILFDFVADGAGPGDLTAAVALSFDISGVRFGSRDAWSGAVLEAPFQLGTVWAGPAWRPSRGIRLLGAGPGVVDTSTRVVAVGGTVWAIARERLRSLGFEMSLPESEIEALPPNGGLRQLISWCGTSRPLLVVPKAQSALYGREWCLYGYLEDTPPWPFSDKSSDGLEARVALVVRESR